jgi:hypothetical protein
MGLHAGVHVLGAVRGLGLSVVVDWSPTRTLPHQSLVGAAPVRCT